MVSIKSVMASILVACMVNLPVGAVPVETGLVEAAPANSTPPEFHPDLIQRCVGRGYATFYDDNACRSNPSVAFSMANPACLTNQRGRNSIYIQASCVDRASLVWSPGGSCNCQNDCSAVAEFNSGNGNGCWNLNGHAFAESFRFIGSRCDRNNC